MALKLFVLACGFGAVLAVSRPLHACTLTGATLTIAGDDQYDVWLNGTHLGACCCGGTSGCWTNNSAVVVDFPTDFPLSTFLTASPACNVLQVQVKTENSGWNGGTWLMVMKYSDCPDQWITSDGKNTAAKYIPNGGEPAGWLTAGFNESGWIGPYTATSGYPNPWADLALPGGGTAPWAWGEYTFNATTVPNDSTLFRQHFQLGQTGNGSGGSCAIAPLPTPTALGTPPTATRTSTPSGFTPTFTATRTRTPTPTATRTPSPTPSWTLTSTRSFTFSPTLTRTPTYTWTPTATVTVTFTATRTHSPTPTWTPTVTQTVTFTPSLTPSPTRTHSPTATTTVTFTPSATYTWTLTHSPTPTRTVTFTPSSTYTATPTWTPTATRTVTFTASSTSTMTSTWTPTATQTITFTPSSTYTVTPTHTPTATQTVTSTDSPTRTDSPTPSPTNTDGSTPTYTVSPTETATPSSTSTNSSTPTASPTGTPTFTRSHTPTITQTSTISPVASPTNTPTITFTPTQTPSVTPTSTDSPFNTPTNSPTSTPTATPSPTPSLTSTRSTTSTWTPTQTGTSTATPSLTATPTVTDTPTASATLTVTATYTPQAPFQVKLQVYNSAGEIVATIADGLPCYQQPDGLKGVEPSFVPDEGGLGSFMILGPQLDESWDGKASTGQWVSSGTYLVTAEVTDSFGHATTFSTQLTVVRVDHSVQVEIYNGAGELVRHYELAGAAASSSGVNLSSTNLTGDSGVDIDYGSGQVTWDGTNDSGNMAQSGQYLVKVTRSTGKGEVQVFSQSVTLLNSPNASLDGAFAAPNPALAGAKSLTIWLPATSAGLKVRGEIFNLAGEKAGEAVLDTAAPSILSWNLKGNEAAGIYLIRLTAQDNRGRTTSKILKGALLR